MSSDPIKELEAAKARVEELQNQFIGELASLPEKFGFKTLDEFVKAVKSASLAKVPSAKRGRKPGRKAVKTEVAVKKKSSGRARITDEVRASVKKLIEEGKSGAEIAKTLSISLPSVQNIKKAFGLVKARVEAAPAAVETTPIEVSAPALS